MRLIVIFIILALAAAIGFFTFNMISDDDKQVVVSSDAPAKDMATTVVYVAKEPIQVGAIIDQSMLAREQWPSHLVLNGFAVESKEAPSAVGMVVRSPFQKNEPILMSKLANKDDPSFLAASLAAGKRAVTISANPISGLAGFVYPGDRVDILITHELVKTLEDDPTGASNAAGSEGGTVTPLKEVPHPMTEILVPDVRVLAINQRARSEDEQAENDRRNQISSVTLEVDQDDAQRLRLAEKSGQLSLVLRSLEDKDVVSWVNPTTDNDLTRVLPKSYYPQLFGFDGTYEAKISQDIPAVGVDMVQGQVPGSNKKETVLVVRGVKVEEMEITQP